jgi:lysyl-tRNA synthetase class 2
MLRKRAELLARVRSFFAERAFLEVETPLLSADTIVDRHLDPLRVILPEDPRDPTHGPTRWLQTSPEFGMKRLMAAGGEAIFQITRAFRAGESGERHNPEFTMVEWYRRGDTLEQGVQLLSDLAEALFERGPSELVSYADAFRRAGLVEDLDLRQHGVCRSRHLAAPADVACRRAWARSRPAGHRLRLSRQPGGAGTPARESAAGRAF